MAEDRAAKIARIQKIERIKALEAQQAAPENDSVNTDGVETALRSGVEGLTFGLTEPLISGMNAAGQKVSDVLMQMPAEARKSYSDYYDQDVARRRKLKSENRAADIGGQVVGALAPAVLTFGESAPLSAERALTVLPEAVNAAGQSTGAAIRAIPGAEALLKSKGVAGSVARIGEGATKAAVQGTLAQDMQQQVELASGHMKPEEERSIADLAIDSAEFGGALHAIPEVAGQAGRALKGAARVLTGVKGEAIDKYLERPDAIRNAKSVEEIKAEVDSTIQKLADDVETSKISKEQATDAFRQAQSRVDDLVRENKNIIASQKNEIKTQLRESKSKLDDAYRVASSEVKTARLPIQADDVLDSVEKVKQQVTDLSTESYKILDLHKGKFNLKGVTNSIGKIQNDLKVNGVLLSEDAENAYNKLDGWKEKLKQINAADKTGKGQSGAQIKRIIQELDSDMRTASDKLAGSFSDKTHAALMKMRYVLDQKIKTQVPGYAEVMGETAKMNNLRADLSKLFGKRQTVVGKLANIQNPNSEYERNLLKELGTLSGKDFTTPLDELMTLKSKGRSAVSMEDMKRNLPEYQDYVQSLASDARTRRPGYGSKLIEQAQTGSPEAAALRTAQGNLNSAATGIETAKAAYAPYKSISPANSENFIRTLMGDRTRKIELKKVAAGLGQLSDENFTQMIDDLRVKEGFQKGFQNGSSNVNLWAALAAVFGFISGDPTFGMASGGAGAAFGKVMDAYGPQVTRRVLDGIIFMKGIPTIQKINQTFGDLPPALREQIKSDLVRSVLIGNSTPIVTIPPEQRKDVAKDFFDSKHLDSIQKADAIDSINKTGAVDSKLMQQVMVGQEQPPEPVQPQVQERPHAHSLEQISDFVNSKKKENY